jgi:hypothetical protein
MEDAIWADDLDSDDDCDDGVAEDEECDEDDSDNDAREDDAAYGMHTEEADSASETRSPSYAGRRYSEEGQSDQDFDDSTSAMSDDPPTGRGRRNLLRQESMTRYRQRNHTSDMLRNARLKFVHVSD